jgi:hypothetical protein
VKVPSLDKPNRMTPFLHLCSRRYRAVGIPFLVYIFGFLVVLHLHSIFCDFVKRFLVVDFVG